MTRDNKRAPLSRNVKAGPFHIRTGDQFRAEYVPREDIIDGLLPRGRLITTTAPGDTGKTTFWTTCSAFIANGRRFNGRDVTKGHVIYATREAPDLVRESYTAIVDHWKDSGDEDFDESSFHALTCDEQEGLINSVENIKTYANELAGGISLIVVDTQAAWSPITLDELKNSDQRDYARALRELTKLPGKPNVMVLSHPTKAPKNAQECRPRGGAAFEYETDGNWTLWRGKDSGVVEVAWTRLKYSHWEPFHVRIEQIETTSIYDKRGRPITTVHAVIISDAELEKAALQARSDEDKIVIALGTGTPKGAKSIALDTGLLDRHEPGDPKLRKAYKTRLRGLQRQIRAMADHPKADRLIEKFGRYYRLTTKGRVYADEILNI